MEIPAHESLEKASVPILENVSLHVSVTCMALHANKSLEYVSPPSVYMDIVLEDLTLLLLSCYCEVLVVGSLVYATLLGGSRALILDELLHMSMLVFSLCRDVFFVKIVTLQSGVVWFVTHITLCSPYFYGYEELTHRISFVFILCIAVFEFETLMQEIVEDASLQRLFLFVVHVPSCRSHVLGQCGSKRNRIQPGLQGANRIWERNRKRVCLFEYLLVAPPLLFQCFAIFRS